MKSIAIQATTPTAVAAGCSACVGAVDPARRHTLRAMAGAAWMAAVGAVSAADDTAPQAGDWLVQVDDDAMKPLVAADFKIGDKPMVVFPCDPVTKTLRDGSRLNRIVLVRLEPATLDAPTAARAADGIVAYSAFCTHQGCDVSSWVAAEKVLLCFCHFSKFAPQQEAAVTGGPAPRPLPALPIKLQDDKLVIAGRFTAAPGKAV